MNDSLRQTGRSYKQILDALEKLTDDEKAISCIHYVIPDGQQIYYYLDMATTIFKNKQTIRKGMNFKVNHALALISFVWSVGDRKKYLCFKHKQVADAQDLPPFCVIRDHSFSD